MNLFKLRFNSKYFIPIILSFLLNAFSQTRDSTSAPALPIKQPIKPTISDTSAKKPLARDTGSIKTKPIDTSATAKTKAATDTGKNKLTDTVYYSAEGGYIDYDVENKTMHLIGNAMVKYQKVTLFADTITYHIDDALLSATGRPQLVETGDTTIGETMLYNMKTRRGRVRYASTHMDDAYFNGRQIIKSDKNELYVDQGDYTTCAFPDTPHYYFSGKNIKLVPDDKIISRPVVLSIGDAPVAYLPFLIFPINRDRKSGILTPSYGGHPESGGYIDNLGYYWVPNDYIDLLGYFRIQDFQQVVFNGATNYNAKYLLSGAISGRYTYDGNFAQQSQQWSLDYSHNQNITPDGNLTLSGRGSLVSNKTFYRYFSEDSSELLNQVVTSNLSLAKRFEGINASANINWNRTQNLHTDEISQDLPSISFSLPSRPIFPYTPPEETGNSLKPEEPPWYTNFQYSYNINGLQKIHSTPGDTSNYQRKAITQGLNLSAPLKVLKYFTLSPYFSSNVSTFDSWLDTAAYDTVHVSDTTFDTIASSKIVPTDTFRIIDTIATLNNQSSLYDTTFKRIKQINVRGIPQYRSHNQWTSDYSWNTGTNFSTILYGLYGFNFFNFAGIRHQLTPTIGYNFTPKHELDRKYYPIASYDGPHDQSQKITLSLDNQFQGKTVSPSAVAGEKPKENKFQILSLGLSTAYDFEAKTRKWSDLNITGSTSYNIVRISGNYDFWLYDQSGMLSRPLLRNYSLNLSTNTLAAKGTLWEGDKIVLNGIYPKDDLRYHNAGPQTWQVSISPSYSFSESRNTPSDAFVPQKNYSLSTSASLNFTRIWSMSWSSYYNFVTNQMVGHNFHFACDLECWDLRFDWQPGGSYNAGYYFKINIKKIPEIFWEQRG
jgi:lipopolysaccharide assembly outer membrane protein LptD (OstA)